MGKSNTVSVVPFIGTIDFSHGHSPMRNRDVENYRPPPSTSSTNWRATIYKLRFMTQIPLVLQCDSAVSTMSEPVSWPLPCVWTVPAFEEALSRVIRLPDRSSLHRCPDAASPKVEGRSAVDRQAWSFTVLPASVLVQLHLRAMRTGRTPDLTVRPRAPVPARVR